VHAYFRVYAVEIKAACCKIDGFHLAYNSQPESEVSGAVV
jgi:hypothetical protein